MTTPTSRPSASRPAHHRRAHRPRRGRRWRKRVRGRLRGSGSSQSPRAALKAGDFEPRRGLAGLFDSRKKRLKGFRLTYAQAAAILTDATETMTARVRASTLHSGALDGVWGEMRGAVTDLDVHLTAAARRVSVQAADARAAGALTRCAEGVAAWLDGWKDALGRAGKRPKRVQPDPTVLVAMRDDLLARIDRAMVELTSASTRRAEVERRMSAVRASL